MITEKITKAELTDRSSVIAAFLKRYPQSVLSLTLATLALISAVHIYMFVTSDPTAHPFSTGNFNTGQWLAYMAAPILILAALYTMIGNFFRRKSTRLELGASDIDIQKGFTAKQKNILPYRFIRRIDIKRGLLDKLFGTATLAFSYNNHKIGSVQKIKHSRAKDLRAKLFRRIIKSKSKRAIK